MKGKRMSAPGDKSRICGPNTGRFKPGNRGKPRGARNRATIAVESLMEGEAEKLGRKAVELALAGDTVALRLCLDRLCPPRRNRPVNIALPAIETAAALPHASMALLNAVARGALTPAEAVEVAKLLDLHIRAIEASELEVRL